MNEVLDLVYSKVEKIKRALQQGKKVFVGSTEVKSIEVRPSKRSVVIVINGGEVSYYPSEFIDKRVSIIE